MRKLIVVVAVAYGALALAKLMPEAGFYVLLLSVIALIALARGGRKGGAGAALERGRTREAVKAVRRGMSYVDASRQYGVPEHAIRRMRQRILYYYFY